ncbi:MAG: iron-containing alcohol dehydrogenase [Hungatella sp.]|nr:iron-containing alcohol dehydrogenase [Hungatella sp.]
MSLYQLNIPTKVYFGRDIWRESLKAQKEMLKGTILLVTTGRSLARLGYVGQMKQQILENTNAENVVIFDNISANPRLSEVKTGILSGRREKAKAVVGFGGGSAMDAAKAIAAGIREKEEIETFFYRGREPGKVLPLVAIPTTAGTGSELSKAAIITDESRKIKKGIRGAALYPKVAIVDSVFTESVPYNITMETGFDVLAHGMESYVSKAASLYTEMQSEQALRIVGTCLPVLAENLQYREAREKMSFASMIMGINLGNASTCLPHRMQYPLGAHTDTSHGAGLAALFTAWIAYEYSHIPEKIEKALELLTGEKVQGKTACAEHMSRFIKKLGLPTSLSELGVDKPLLKIMAEEVEGNLKNDPSVQGEDRSFLLKLYEAAWQ